MVITGAYSPWLPEGGEPRTIAPAPSQPSATPWSAPTQQTTTGLQSGGGPNSADEGMSLGMSPLEFLRRLMQGQFGFSRFKGTFDPSALNDPEIRKWFESMGIKIQVKPSDNGIPSGRIVLPDGTLVDLNVNGMWGWLQRAFGGGGGVGGGGAFGNFSGLTASPYAPFGGAGGTISGDLAGNSVFSDPATTEWEHMLRQLVLRMQQPYSDPDETATENYMRSYFNRLQGPAYTPQEMDLLNTQQIDPLTADRDANRQKVLLWAQSHGMTPESGPVQQMLMDSDRQYEALRTRARADIGTRAIDLGRENEARAMQVGSALAALKEHMFNFNENRFGQSVSLFKQIPELADTRLQLAMAALGMGGGGALNGAQNALNLLGQFQNSRSGGGTDSNANFWSSLLGAGLTGLSFL
jgi:hypothetical protein